MAQDGSGAWLEGLSGEWAGRQAALGESTSIGRGTGCIVRLQDRQASRHHAVIRYAQGRYFLQDQGSTHGTSVNGRQVQAVALNDGDMIAVGSATFRFRLGHMAAPLVHVPPVALQPPVPQPPVSQPAPQWPPPSKGAMTGDEFDRIGMRTLALSKSYVGVAFLTWFLYWLLYIPGLIMNIVYLQEANRLKQATGVTPSGKGCLDALLVIYVWVPLAVGILALILAAVGAINLQDLLGGF